MNPKSVYQKHMEAVTDWADKEMAASLLEATAKQLKAQIAIGFRDNGCSISEALLRAEASEQFMDAERRKIKARHEANNARGHVKAVEGYVDAWRTVEASERAANRYQT